MRLISILTAASLASISFGSTAAATPSGADRVARIYQAVMPPHGYEQFCAAEPLKCQSRGGTLARVEATAERLAELELVNQAVNAEITPTDDREQYGVEEYWTLPRSGKGDCEEYVLLKQQRLLSRNWPMSALLITIVRDESDLGHAVLMVRTKSGDIILDNRDDTLRFWSETPYRFVKRQSYLNPRAWFSMQPPSGDTDQFTATTGHR